MDFITSTRFVFWNWSVMFFVNLTITICATINTHADAPLSVRVVGPASRELHFYLSKNMDLSKHLDEIVKNIVSEIQSKVGDQISNVVKTELANQLKGYDFDAVINATASEKLNEKIASIEFNAESVQKRIDAASGVIVNNINTQSAIEVAALVKKSVADVNFDKRVTDAVSTIINAKIKHIHFPEASINPTSLNLENFVISGDHVAGGIIKNFGSTGIDDRATTCVMTVLDAAVVVENNLVTMDLTVQGNLDVKGTVPETSPFFTQLTTAVTSKVQDGLDTELFSGFSDTIFNTIRTDGLDLSKITVDGRTVIEGNQVGFDITESNLQKLGLLRELQVSGESLLAETLYVGKKRVGVNTMEPSAALAVWDEDIEITASKFKDGVGKIGTPRNQALILGSNKNNNITLNVDGSTRIDDLHVGMVRVSSSEKPPSFNSVKGHIVFNANPSVGGPLGWVCLGAANWANFGIID